MSNPIVQADGWALMKAVRHRDAETVRQILALPDQAVKGAAAAAATANSALTGTAAQIEAGLKQQAIRTNTLLATPRYQGHTALHLAALAGYEVVVAELLAAGASVNILGDEDRTALHIAALSGQGSTAKQLLEAGADIMAADSTDVTALHWAACCGHTSVVQLLLDEGAAVNAGAGCRSGTPLHVAASRGNAAAALIAGGADVNAVDSYGSTPLQQAVPSGVTDVVKLLLAAGADVGLGSYMGGGLGAAAYTACHGKREVFECFMDHISSAPTFGAAVTAEALVLAAVHTSEGLHDGCTDAQRSVVHRLLMAAAKQDAAAAQATLQQRPLPPYSHKAARALLAGVLLDMVVEMSAVQVANMKIQSTPVSDMLVNVAMAERQQQQQQQQ